MLQGSHWHCTIDNVFQPFLPVIVGAYDKMDNYGNKIMMIFQCDACNLKVICIRLFIIYLAAYIIFLLSAAQFFGKIQKLH